jgi:hypothetical protein
VSDEFENSLILSVSNTQPSAENMRLACSPSSKALPPDEDDEILAPASVLPVGTNGDSVLT